MRIINLLLILSLFVMSCNKDKNVINKEWHKDVKRVGMVVKVKPEVIDEYKKLHADGNAGVRDLLEKYNMRNFSIYLVQLADSNWYEFAYYEYWGDNLEENMKKLAEEPRNIEWLSKCDPMQEGIFEEQEGWYHMDKIYFNY
ncbi:MAG TPA: hypothetical protein DEQ09_11045 [Bacteroidales bacterium]|nr:hypothetical protein [Bacteroidales bacterium]